MNITAGPPASGRRSSLSISPWEWSLAFPWSSSSAPTGRAFPEARVASSAKRSPWRECFRSFSNPVFSASFSTAKSAWGPKAHWFSALLVCAGSWLSGFFIIATDAWMQHPVGYTLGTNGEILLSSFSQLLLNPWTFWQYLHNMTGVGSHRQFRHGFGGRILSAHAARRELTAAPSCGWA